MSPCTLLACVALATALDLAGAVGGHVLAEPGYRAGFGIQAIPGDRNSWGHLDCVGQSGLDAYSQTVESESECARLCNNWPGCVGFQILRVVGARRLGYNSKRRCSMFWWKVHGNNCLPDFHFNLYTKKVAPEIIVSVPPGYRYGMGREAYPGSPVSMAYWDCL